VRSAKHEELNFVSFRMFAERKRYLCMNLLVTWKVTY